jgi:hypothetical protein
MVWRSIKCSTVVIPDGRSFCHFERLPRPNRLCTMDTSFASREFDNLAELMAGNYKSTASLATLFGLPGLSRGWITSHLGIEPGATLSNTNAAYWSPEQTEQIRFALIGKLLADVPLSAQWHAHRVRLKVQMATLGTGV